MDARQHPTRWITALALMVLLGAGMAVGLPALDAGYLSGDDETLIFNHALVNHPSLHHAFKLFEIVHRDLYQPFPLLTFQLEFAVHHGTLWILHLTNVFIHIINGMLVWWFLRRVIRSAPHLDSAGSANLVALITAVLFIVHPLSVECFAWLNGRMIMLSTTFTLAALVALDHWQPGTGEGGRREQRRRRSAVFAAVVVFAVFAHLCKVRVELPLLLLLLPVARRFRPSRGWWLMWLVVAALTGCFAGLNIQATSESRLFEGAENQLLGPQGARIVLALAWYVKHYFWPAGLAPYYPAPAVVAWTDTEVLLAAALILLSFGAVVLSWRWTPAVVFGAGWFTAALSPALFASMARNLLAADRYAYLPNIGLYWITALVLYRLISAPGATHTPLLRRALGGALLLAVFAACVAHSRRVTGYYHDRDACVQRILEIAPDHPTLRTTWGWYHFERGEYAAARQLTEQELQLFSADDVAYYRAMNLRAMCRYRLDGDITGALADLQAAIDRDPRFAKSYFRMGIIYAEQHRPDEALQSLERAVELAPEFNPALNLLARVYRRQGRLAEAAALYERAVQSSRGYDVEALSGLGEVEIETGRYGRAVELYRDMFAWYGADIPAGLNLAVALRALGNDAEAWKEYAQLLEVAPTDRRVLRRAAEFLRSTGRHFDALELWRKALNREPGAADLLSGFALQQWFLRDLAGAGRSARAALAMPGDTAVASLTLLLVAVAENRPDEVVQRSNFLLERHAEPGDLLFAEATAALEFQASLDTNSPWPYYVTTVLLLAEGRTDLARQVRGEFDQRCPERRWREQLESLTDRRRLPAENTDNR